MTNPFRQGGGTSAGDSLYIEGKRITGSSTGTSENAVLFDPSNKTANAAGIAMIEAVAKRVADLVTPILDQREKSLRSEIVEAIAQPHADLEPRLKQLESALDVERAKVADAIHTATVGFLSDDDTPPDMDRLERMHQQHKKEMGQ